MKGILFTGGAAPKTDFVRDELKTADMIVAADSGFDTAIGMGIVPEIVLGDMDSIKDVSVFEDYPDLRVLSYPCDKDKTDTELGLLLLRDNKMDEIVLIGGGGGRMDHFLGIVFLFDREISPDIWYTDSTKFQKIKGRIQVSLGIGKEVSFFPCGSQPCQMVSAGLKWPLNGFVWEKGDMSISNRVTEDPFVIEMLKGQLVLLNQLEDDNN
ncbi:MAG: thiamine diphosphokinase [Spirochaetales bacterium]|nr:thiamine diphosphokinase [Spirochaetales bacterium]